MCIVLVSAHRGGAGLWPENTLRGIEGSLELGVDFIECDVRRSRDGHLLLMHDETVDRTTDGVGEVAALEWAALKNLDAGGRATVPLLREVLEVLRGCCHLLCELKCTDVVADAVAMVKKAEMMASVTFLSFDLAHLEMVRARSSEAHVSWLVARPTDISIRASVALGAKWLDVDYRRIDSRLASRVGAAGLALRAWIPNDRESFGRLERLGVRAITTDRPDLLLAFRSLEEIDGPARNA